MVGYKPIESPQNSQIAASDLLGPDAAPLAGLTHGQTITLGNGNQAVYGGLAGADGLGRLMRMARCNRPSSSPTGATRLQRA